MRFMLCISLFFTFHFSFFTSAQAQYRVTHIEKPYNTTGSETGALVVGDTILVYSSMQPIDGSRRLFNFSSPQMQLYQARISRNGKIAKPKPSRWGFNSDRDHTGNLALDPVSHDAYFTRCRIDDPELNCEIYYARKLKRGWEKPRRLEGEVNQKGCTATHPAVGRLDNGSVILYFASNRKGGCGGMDLWYSIVSDGKSGECVNLGPRVNSAADEITPFYDQPNGVLYFSSDRDGGQGGHDIYCAVGSRNTWKEVEPVCGCLNSEQNDIYFNISDYDNLSGRPIGGYLSSNRSDSYFLTDSTCCNDLYRWVVDSGQWVAQEPPAMDTMEENIDTIQQRVQNFMFPLFLYFHNDEPDPQSHEVVTETTYPDCQRHYASLRGEYISRQQNAVDSAMMALFFDTCVVGNFNRTEELLEYVESLLDAGHTITITIAGFASPLARSDYNFNLSRRRIGSFINMIRTWRGGVFEDALAEERLLIVQKPHGDVEPTTESTSQDPVYGLPAALARRIEIISCIVK